MQQSGKILELVDEALGSEVCEEEAEMMVKIAILCANASSSLRPTMSEVVSMLEGRQPTPDITLEPYTHNEDVRFKAIRDFGKQSKAKPEFEWKPNPEFNSWYRALRFLLIWH